MDKSNIHKKPWVDMSQSERKAEVDRLAAQYPKKTIPKDLVPIPSVKELTEIYKQQVKDKSYVETVFDHCKKNILQENEFKIGKYGYYEILFIANNQELSFELQKDLLSQITGAINTTDDYRVHDILSTLARNERVATPIIQNMILDVIDKYKLVDTLICLSLNPSVIDADVISRIRELSNRYPTRDYLTERINRQKDKIKKEFKEKINK